MTESLESGVLLILQPFSHFTYVKTHSPILPSLYLRHSSFSNHSAASAKSQLILQPFLRFSYVTGSSYVTWRAAHELQKTKFLTELRGAVVTHRPNLTFFVGFLNQDKFSVGFSLPITLFCPGLFHRRSCHVEVFRLLFGKF